METTIKFEDILHVQTKSEIHAIRVIYEENNEDWQELKLKTKSLDLELEKYQPIESDIIKHIIESMLSIARISDLMDFPIIHRIVASSSKIAIMTRRGAGNFVIFSESMAQKIKNENYVDNIYSMFKCYVSPYLKEGCLVGYKGVSDYDSGLVLSIIDNKFQIGNILGAEKYYVYIGE